MELKFAFVETGSTQYSPPNCTLVELKYIKVNEMRLAERPPNCTLVELKCNRRDWRLQRILLQIVP